MKKIKCKHQWIPARYMFDDRLGDTVLVQVYCPNCNKTKGTAIPSVCSSYNED